VLALRAKGDLNKPLLLSSLSVVWSFSDDFNVLNFRPQ